MTNTLLVNLYGGPGAGKSTTAAGVFHLLKRSNRNVELVTEYAKELTWEDSAALGFQPRVMGEQLWRLERLRGKVDVIITDSPPLLGIVYGTMPPEPWRWWRHFLASYAESWRRLNVVIERSLHRGYNPSGRNQTQDDAEQIDHHIVQVLTEQAEPYHAVEMDNAVHQVANLIRAEQAANA